MYFHTLFYLHIFQKNTNNVTRTTFPNGPLQFYTADSLSRNFLYFMESDGHQPLDIFSPTL